MQRPGFWDDQAAAARTSAEHASAERRLQSFHRLESDVADLDELAEMAAEDDEMASELATQLDSVEGRLGELEEARLFSGEYDSGDAVVTVHAGAGGTDSQDWAEMLLRMYLRWAERRGYKTDSAVRVTHIPTGVVVQCQNERSQAQNKAVAMQLLRSKLIELQERKRAEELAKERGEVKDVAWGSQIRSYFLHPDQRVKDHRTGHESGDTERVLNGDIDDFVRDYLLKTAG